MLLHAQLRRLHPQRRQLALHRQRCHPLRSTATRMFQRTGLKRSKTGAASIRSVGVWLDRKWTSLTATMAWRTGSLASQRPRKPGVASTIGWPAPIRRSSCPPRSRPSTARTSAHCFHMTGFSHNLIFFLFGGGFFFRAGFSLRRPVPGASVGNLPHDNV